MKSTDSFKYLGIKSTLTGSQQSQLIDTIAHTTNRARLIFTSPFTRLHLKLYLLTHLMPKITYPLSCASFSESHYSRLHKRFIPTAISALGYNRHWLLALRYDKHLYGGLHLKNYKVEALILKIKGLKNLLCKKETSKIVKILISWFQHVVGTSFPILECPPYDL